MQEVTPWPESFDVSEPVARVLVDGREVAVESVTVSSELGTSAPEQVAAGGGGVVAATGSASVFRSETVSESGMNPWGDARALVGADEVVVEAGFRDPGTGGVGCARQITGQVEALSGGAQDNSVELEFVDHTPALDRPITIEPLMQQYPPLEDDGPRLGAGLSTLYVTNRVVRHCGFYSTPPLVNRAIVSAPLFGSGVAERGQLVAGSGFYDDSLLVPSYGTVPWGLGFMSGRLVYEPDYGSRGHARLTSTLHVSFSRAEATATDPGDARITMEWGSWQDAVHVQAQGNGTIIVRYRSGGTGTTVCSLPPADVRASETFTVLVETDGRATIYASNGATATGTAPLPSQATGSNMSRVVVDAPDGAPLIGGVQVGFTATTNHLFERTAHFGHVIYTASEAFPAQIDVNCLDLLKEQSEAELAAMWIDEYGHFRWLRRVILHGSTPVGALTTTENVLDLLWQLPARSMYSQVSVEYEVPTITRRTKASITVANPRGDSLANGDEESLFLEPPGDEDWVQLEPPQWLGGTFSHVELRRGRGSYHGGTRVDSEGDDVGTAYSSNLSQTWSQLHPQKWLLQSSASGLPGDQHIEQRFRDSSTYGRFAGEPVPLIRARGLVHWETQTTFGTARGRVHAPEFTHPVGPWLQNPNSRASLLNFLDEHLIEPSVILRDIPIVPDPRIQLGDTFWLVDDTTYHVRLRVLVMGKSLTYQTTNDGVEMSQHITCRIVAVERLKVTYQDLADAWESMTYQQFQNAWAGSNYQALEANPLDRT